MSGGEGGPGGGGEEEGRSGSGGMAGVARATVNRLAPGLAVGRGAKARAAATAVRTDQAPEPLGPYSQAIRSGDTLWVSGCIGLIPGTKAFAEGGVVGEAEQVMKNMGAVLEAGGATFDDVVKTTVLVADMADFAKVNSVYEKFFSKSKPARSCFAVKELPLGALVEIECVASFAE